jgi:hypothetical protein
MKKLLVWASIITAIAASVGMHTYAFPGENFWWWDTMHENHENMMTPMWMKGHLMQSGELKAAIEANDYNAFVTAWNEAHSTRVAPTQDAFIKQAKEITLHDQMQAAVVANDYTSFTAAQQALQALHPDASTQKPALTQEQFTKHVTMYKQHETINNALKANDYNAFLTAWNAAKPNVPSAEEFATLVKNKDRIKDTMKSKQQKQPNMKKKWTWYAFKHDWYKHSQASQSK